MTRTRARPPRRGDPYGLGIGSSALAPGLAVVGLLVVALVTFNLFNGDLPFATRGNQNGGGPIAGPDITPAPSNVVIPEPEAVIQGAIVYAKAGNIWVQTDDAARQVTNGGTDSMPSWSPDGEWIYYVHTDRAEGRWFERNELRDYIMDVPSIMRIRADGSAEPERVKSGRFRQNGRTWFYWLRQPVLSPDGRTLALVTDAPNPDEQDVVLQFYDLERERFTAADAPQNAPLGHQDPSWRSDGRYVLYVRNARSGSRGSPVISRYDTEERRARAISAPGYLQPHYSPDGRFIAATRQRAFGNDVVILDGSRGTELVRVTNDGASSAPVWSPAGDAIAFLHLEHGIVDLRMARVEPDGTSLRVTETVDLTTVSGLDAASRPDWFVPPEELPATPPPTAPGGSPARSAAP